MYNYKVPVVKCHSWLNGHHGQFDIPNPIILLSKLVELPVIIILLIVIIQLIKHKTVFTGLA